MAREATNHDTATAGRAGLPRAADVLLAAVGLVVTAPFLLVAAIAIKLTSRGPVIYRQRRIGRGGAPFELYKLRTMRLGADPVGVGTPVLAGDPRVTSVGRLLRRFSLDEAPNLVNVLHGEMAVVGPRPTLEAQVDLYTPRQRRRLEVKPGLTGWAQVNYHYGATVDDAHTKLQYDLFYIQEMSPFLDLVILLKTFQTVLFKPGY